jgi:hypothetical protein
MLASCGADAQKLDSLLGIADGASGGNLLETRLKGRAQMFASGCF